MLRRDFLKSTGAALAFSALPTALIARQANPFDGVKKRVALIGTGWYGKSDLFRLVPWAYADTVFRRKWDNMISMVKAYQYGFTEMIDSEQMMKDIIGDFRTQKIIP